MVSCIPNALCIPHLAPHHELSLQPGHYIHNDTYDSTGSVILARFLDNHKFYGTRSWIEELDLSTRVIDARKSINPFHTFPTDNFCRSGMTKLFFPSWEITSSLKDQLLWHVRAEKQDVPRNLIAFVPKKGRLSFRQQYQGRERKAIWIPMKCVHGFLL